MKISYFLIPGVALFAIISLASCRTTYDSPSQFDGQSVQWGRGGGITGIEERYILLPSRQLFKQSRVGAEAKELVHKLPKKATKRIFRVLDTMNFPAPQSNGGYNAYQFIDLYFNNKEVHHVTWPQGDAASMPTFLGRLKNDLYNIAKHAPQE